VVEFVETTIVGLFLPTGVSTGSTTAFYSQDSSVAEPVEAPPPHAPFDLFDKLNDHKERI